MRKYHSKLISDSSFGRSVFLFFPVLIFPCERRTKRRVERRKKLLFVPAHTFSGRSGRPKTALRNGVFAFSAFLLFYPE
ncbi:MAG: hypothetical protein C6W56_15655 [Caldibacillus debilis]|nr:MAG: hypothetical protein C6W56_15655 [Caldibacillus debilis]